jgi:beta-galactosidase
MKLKNHFFRISSAIAVCGSFVVASVSAAPFQPPQTAREKLNFDLNWKFKKNDQSGAQAPTYNDDSWTTIHLPHTFQKVSVAGDNVDRGMGWYRKHFTLSSAYQNKVLTLYFEGAMSVSTVYINGTQLTINYGGFHPFCYDITQYCKTDGSDNVIALKLNNASDNMVPPQNPLTGIDYELYGGLNKDVYLIATDKLYVPESIHSWNSGWADQGGHYITYSNVTSNSATVKVETYVKNATGAAVTGKLVTSIVDAVTNALVQSNEATLTAAATGVTHVTQTIAVTGIKPWAPWSPNLYRVHTVVYNGTAPVDIYSTRIGIRDITWNKTTGMFVNGTSCKIIGLNRTNQWVFLGHACPNNQQKRDAATLREWGCNFVRCSHYPMDDAFYDGCDSAGLLLWVEVPAWHCCATKPSTNATWVGRMENELRFMVRNGRNRASIAVWGAGLNEAEQSDEYERPMNTLCLNEDPTRPTTGARQSGTGRAGNNFTLLGQNQFCPGELPNSNPDPNTVGYINSEHTGHMFHNHSNRALHSEQELLDHATMMACVTSDSRARGAWCNGSLGWCAFDYYTHWNTSFQWRAVHGVFDVMHIPKPAAYFYRSQSGGDNYDGSKNPYIKIANFYAANSPADRRVYSNCQQVKLYQDATVIATQSPDKTPYYVNSVGRPSSTWSLAHPPFTFKSVAYKANSMLIAEGLINNQVVARDTVRAQGAASTIKLIADPPVIEANGQDISRIEAYIVDANGTWIHSAKNSVSWTLSGTGAELYGDNPISAQAGACIILAKANLTPGTVTLQASSNGLTSQSVAITVVASGTTDVAPLLPVNRTEARASVPWHAMVRGNHFVLPAEIPLPAVIALYTVGGEQVYRGVARDRSVRIGDRRCLPFGVYIIKQLKKR